MIKLILILASIFAIIHCQNLCGDWTPYGNRKCIKVVHEVVKQEAALYRCLQLGGTLLAINDQREQNFINQFVDNKNRFMDKAWIGMRYNGSHYSWLDGRHRSFNNWDPSANRRDECVHMSLSRGRMGKWRDSQCEEKVIFICERYITLDNGPHPGPNPHLMPNPGPDITYPVNTCPQSRGLDSKEALIIIENMHKDFRDEIRGLYHIIDRKILIQFEPQIVVKDGGCCGGGANTNADDKEWKDLRDRLDKLSKEFDYSKIDLDRMKTEYMLEIDALKVRVKTLEEKGTGNQNKNDGLDDNYYKSRIDQLQLRIDELKKKGEGGEKQTTDPVPIGFIYTQLPDQPSPQELWANLQWTDITSQYAGLFFRAEGGGSAPFGKTQQSNQTWISNIAGRCFSPKKGKDADYNVQDWTQFPLANNMTGFQCINTDTTGVKGIRLFTTGGEVRPKNTAVRIWKRVEKKSR